ncbi:MAG: hypothetical protein RMI45_07610 [Ignisphaera sp.]|nr:hypothetical protein [Ignisphaera sp.]MDW8086083.1 hypothetical protein [Ignisphaera sp.]
MMEYLMFVVLGIAIFVDLVYRSEYASLAMLVGIILFLAVDLWLWAAVLTLIAITHRIAMYVFRGGTTKAIGVKHIFIHVIKPLVYIAIALLLYASSWRLVFPLMDRWTSVLIYITVVFLALSLTTNPSIDSMVYIGRCMYMDVATIIKALAIAAHVIGVPLLFYSYIFLGNSAFIVILLWIIYMFSRGTLSIYRRTILEILPYLVALILIEVIT